MESIYPERLEVELTARHLSASARVNPLEAAVRDTLKREGIELSAVVGADTVTIMRENPSHGHAARYYIPDDLWKLVVRHQTGKRVKPGTFALEAVYREWAKPAA